MNRILQLPDSTVGQKTITGATGLGLLAFVIGHLLGNLQMFLGQEVINSYAYKLNSLGVLLWVARIGLLGLIVLHIAMTVRLALRNRKAAGLKNARVTRRASTTSSRSMIISGSVILAFVVFHLLHFTVGAIQPAAHGIEDAAGRHDVFTMVVRGFENWFISTFYIVAMLLLMSHLTHATFSVFQTLGIVRLGKDSRLKTAARVVAVALAVGFIAIPVAVMMGLIRA